MRDPVSNPKSLAARIDALLPQTQCRQCGFSGCSPYAEAVAHGEADINRCPPGGQDTVGEIARLVGVPTKPLDPECGAPSAPAVALIEEALCIGCTLCIQACPVDAIVGAAKLMHTVIAAECTGCKLCIPPCPVDCITMEETGERIGPEERGRRAQHFRDRYAARTARLARDRAERQTARRESAAERRKQAMVERVMQRARMRLQRRNG
ncbi:MAG TPA: RnfABCDGE type electron transport complex subunit B [Burkholderiales bacterium]|nr:RnfABCDGE type electron transport complex subunit B [Burkholderiales bacterium]